MSTPPLTREAPSAHATMDRPTPERTRMAGPTTTAIKLAQCPRCDGYVFASTSGGIKVAADPAPVTRDGYVAALVAGRRLFGLATIAGRPHKLLSRAPGAKPPAFTPEGVQEAPTRAAPYATLVEHGCGAGGQDAKPVPVATEEPVTACGQWRSQGWTPPPGKCARDRGQNVTGCELCSPPPFDHGGAAEASTRTPRQRQKVPGRVGAQGGTPQQRPTCDTCGKVIGAGELHWGIQHGAKWMYAEHVECP